MTQYLLQNCYIFIFLSDFSYFQFAIFYMSDIALRALYVLLCILSLRSIRQLIKLRSVSLHYVFFEFFSSLNLRTLDYTVLVGLRPLTVQPPSGGPFRVPIVSARVHLF